MSARSELPEGMKPVTANQVADFFLCFAQKHGDVLTPLKLQKLIYYAQAWHLALKGSPLFEERIEAWIHGPVVRSAYSRFRNYRWKAIDKKIDSPNIPQRVASFLEEVFSVYGRYSAWDLERMTHHEAPWQNARKGLALDEEGTQEISQKDMRKFYRARAAA